MGLFDAFPDPEPTRVLCWFSCGVTSAVACKLTLGEHPDALIVRIRIGTEHEDADLTAAGRYAEGDDGVVCYTTEIGDRDIADVRASFLAAYSEGHAAKCTVREVVV